LTTIGDIDSKLSQWAPPSLAESWDNTGLLLGDRHAPVLKVMTCLTITPLVVEEAIGRRVSLIVSHHPLPFRPIREITTDQTTGRLLWDLATHRVNVLSLHTRYDSAVAGINQQLAETLQLVDVQPLELPGFPSSNPGLPGSASGVLSQSNPTAASSPGQVGGRGRWGRFSVPRSLTSIANSLKQALKVSQIQHVSSGRTEIQTAAIGCGSAGEFLKDAKQRGCELLLVGETNFHTCLEAQAAKIELLLVGHFASERFAQEVLAQRLAIEFPTLEVWCSESETDPIGWL
jgi:dinuclear metal center YbgI/SA1388 family protein